MRITELLDEIGPVDAEGRRVSEVVADRGRASARRGARASCRRASKLVVVTHENPDGDALGSLVAMQGILSAIGKDCLMFIAQSDLPLPQEYTFLPLQNLVTEPPADLAERTLVFLDCGNLERNPAEAFRGPGLHILNIDHHHDNTRFGTVNLVVDDASCTAEIVWELMHELEGRRRPRRRRGAVRRADHRHRALHVREHRSDRAPDGGRSDRRGRRRPRDLPPRL